MTKTETLRRLAAATNENRLEHLAQQIEKVHQSKVRSADELAEILEPLAQAMAALTDETRQTLEQVRRESSEQAERLQQQSSLVSLNWHAAATKAQQAADSLNRVGERQKWIHYTGAVLIGILSAGLASAFWHWRAPPIPSAPTTIEGRLDPQAVADLLKPIVTEALKRSKSK